MTRGHEKPQRSVHRISYGVKLRAQTAFCAKDQPSTQIVWQPFSRPMARYRRLRHKVSRIEHDNLLLAAFGRKSPSRSTAYSDYRGSLTVDISEMYRTTATIAVERDYSAPNRPIADARLVNTLRSDRRVSLQSPAVSQTCLLIITGVSPRPCKIRPQEPQPNQ